MIVGQVVPCGIGVREFMESAPCKPPVRPDHFPPTIELPIARQTNQCWTIPSCGKIERLARNSVGCRRHVRPQPGSQMDEIKPLTSLRGFAALAVVMQHFSTSAQTLTPQRIPSLVPHGYMAVDFFFVSERLYHVPDLSLLDSGRVDLKAFPGFMLKRVARIVPLNLFVLDGA